MTVQPASVSRARLPQLSESRACETTSASKSVTRPFFQFFQGLGTKKKITVYLYVECNLINIHFNSTCIKLLFDDVMPKARRSSPLHLCGVQ